MANTLETTNEKDIGFSVYLKQYGKSFPDNLFTMRQSPVM